MSFRVLPAHTTQCTHPAGCGQVTGCSQLVEGDRAHWCTKCGLYKEGCVADEPNVINLADPLPAEQADEITLEEWMALGKKLYGKVKFNWRFVCPCCQHVQSIKDFQQFKNRGATPETAFQDCIGRWLDNTEGTMMNDKSPCDYTINGLFKLSQRVVVTPEGRRVSAFKFADEEQQ